MRTRILSLIGALALCFVALAGVGAAEAASCPSNFCYLAQQDCLTGCPCALFECNPAKCTYMCTCPIICWD